MSAWIARGFHSSRSAWGFVLVVPARWVQTRCLLAVLFLIGDCLLHCSKLLLLSTHEIALGLCFHVLILPQGRRDDLPCSMRLVRGEEAGDNDPKQLHGPFPINKPGKQGAEDGLHLLCQLEALLAAGGPGHQLEAAP